MPADVAVMVQVPAPTPVALPTASMLATVGSLQVQLTTPEMSPVVLSAKFPLAVKVVVVPFAIDMVAGATAMEFNWAEVTVIVPELDMTPPLRGPLSIEAVIVVIPTALAAVTRPVLAPTFATAEALEVQVARVVTSATAAFEYVPVALRVAVVPDVICSDVG